MRKTLLAPLLVCIVALLFTLSVFAVQATTPAPNAGGRWQYTLNPGFPVVTKVADGNTFKYGEESGIWTGTFVGESDDVFTLVMHSAHASPTFANVKGLINFDGTVNGEEGTLVIRFVGKRTLPAGEWYGQWAILSGTDALANLHGQGNWWGPPTNVEYSGHIHFS